MGKSDKRRKPREASPSVPPQGSEAEETPGKRHWKGWWLLAILGLVFAAYSNSFHGALVFDNAVAIGQDPRIRQATPQNIESILHGGYWYVSKIGGLYRPFTTLSYLLNYAVLGNGANTLGYHVVNLLLHEVNVVLVYALGILIFGEAAPALALAALWGVHPVLTESVTNIVGRADLLAAFGVLAGLLCYAKSVSAMGKRRIAWLAGVAAAQGIGLFSKESAAVLPGIMLLYDLTWSERAKWRQRAPAYAALAVVFAVFFYLRSSAHLHMRIDPAENPLITAGFWTARLTAVKVIGMFLWLFLWPARLSADYSFNAVPISNWEDVEALLALAVCLGAFVLAVLLAVRWRRTGKPLLFFLVFFFAAFSPVSNLIMLIGAIMAERFLYLPSVGLAGCVVAGIYTLRKRALRQIGWATLGVVCMALAARTYARNFDWEDKLSLWSSAVNAYPESARPHFNLGNALGRIPGRLPEAIAEYQAALRILPDDADSHTNLGNALARTPGHSPEVIAEYQAAARIRPGNADAHSNLAGELAEAGRLPEAVAEYQAAVRIRPDRAELHYNLGRTLAGIPGHLPDAIAEYREALRLRPDDAETHYNLGNALVGIPGRLPEAIAEYRAALRLRPDRADIHNNLGSALAGIPGRLPEAVAEYQAALRIQPDNAELHYNLANALMEIPGRAPEAIAEYEAAQRIRPDPRIRQILDRLRAGR